MPQLDPTSFLSQIFWLAISFVILYLVMSRVALPRVADVLEARQSRIALDLDEAARLKTEAEVALATYEATMAEARSTAQALLAKAAEERAEQAAARNAELDARLGKRLAEAEARIVAAKEAALDEVDRVAADIARSATERLIGAAPDADKARAAVALAREGG